MCGFAELCVIGGMFKVYVLTDSQTDRQTDRQTDKLTNKTVRDK